MREVELDLRLTMGELRLSAVLFPTKGRLAPLAVRGRFLRLFSSETSVFLSVSRRVFSATRLVFYRILTRTGVTQVTLHEMPSLWPTLSADGSSPQR